VCLVGRRRVLLAVGALGLALLVAGGGVTVLHPATRRVRAVAAGAAGRLRTSSSPSARLYEWLAERLLAGCYERLAAEVADALREVGGTRVLEVGPGPGGVCIRLAASHSDVCITALDIDPDMITLLARRARREGLAERVAVVVGDVAAMPFEDATFDVVVSSFSVHHWSAAGAGFAEIRRVLRPAGRGLVYDLPDAWGRLETGARGLAAAAMAGGFRDARPGRVRWPGRVEVIERLVVQREA
jgi:SAM-dependent methyltransferase